jgi:hypothetical protein
VQADASASAGQAQARKVAQALSMADTSVAEHVWRQEMHAAATPAAGQSVRE